MELLKQRPETVRCVRACVQCRYCYIQLNILLYHPYTNFLFFPYFLVLPSSTQKTFVRDDIATDTIISKYFIKLVNTWTKIRRIFFWNMCFGPCNLWYNRSLEMMEEMWYFSRKIINKEFFYSNINSKMFFFEWDKPRRYSLFLIERFITWLTGLT